MSDGYIPCTYCGGDHTWKHCPDNSVEGLVKRLQLENASLQTVVKELEASLAKCKEYIVISGIVTPAMGLQVSLADNNKIAQKLPNKHVTVIIMEDSK